MIRPAVALALVALVAGCSGGRESVRELIGVTLERPDPFNVSPRAPLRLPSDLSALPPPQPGVPSPLDPTPLADARAALTGIGPTDGAAPGAGEQALLAAAGAGEADPDIRLTLETDPLPAPDADRYALRSLFGVPIPDGSEAERLDARVEAERLSGTAPTPPPLPPEVPSNVFIVSQ